MEKTIILAALMAVFAMKKTIILSTLVALLTMKKIIILAALVAVFALAGWVEKGMASDSEIMDACKLKTSSEGAYGILIENTDLAYKCFYKAIKEQ